MHLEAHAALGWVIGNAGQNSRRVRNWCVAAAVIPDIDAIPYVFGPEAYGRWHHTFGHNLFLLIALSGAAAWHCRARPAASGSSARAFWFTAAGFASHLVTDAFFSGWYLYLLWPVSSYGYLPEHHVGLEHPINVWLIYLGLVAVIGIGALRKRTPVDIFWPKLDAIIVGLFRSRPLSCSVCGRPGNQRCHQCGRPTCARHARLTRHADIVCPDCLPGRVIANSR
jgi:hypothetical protein